MTPQDAFRIYVAIKMHFKGQYNYFKNGFKIKVHQDSFNQRADKWAFESVSRKFTKQRFCEYLVANSIKRDLWIGDLIINIDTDENYFEWKKRHIAMTHYLNEDIKFISGYLKDENLQVQHLFKVENGREPIILNMLYENEICLETFVMLFFLSNNIKLHWEQAMDKVVRDSRLLFVNRYRGFICFDQSEYNDIVKHKLLHV